MTADVRQLNALATVFTRNAIRAHIEVAAVVNRGALNIKNGWRANATATAGRHARLYPGSITYDMRQTPVSISAEIGPEKSRPQGALGNLLEFGSVNNPPHMDGMRALMDEAPNFVMHIAAVAARFGR